MFSRAYKHVSLTVSWTSLQICMQNFVKLQNLKKIEQIILQKIIQGFIISGMIYKYK